MGSAASEAGAEAAGPKGRGGENRWQCHGEGLALGRGDGRDLRDLRLGGAPGRLPNCTLACDRTEFPGV